MAKENNSEKILDTKQKLYNMERLGSELRSNENVIEHFPQIVVLVMFILMRESKVTFQKNTFVSISAPNLAENCPKTRL